MEVIIKHSSKKDKKYDAIIDGKKTVSFGAAGASDYTIHKDDARKQRYIDRHKNREVWTKEGLKTAGFYAKNVLWNKPTIQESIKDLNNKYKDIKFKLK
jgi:hypothetical protein